MSDPVALAPQKRTYRFPGFDYVVIENVCELIVRESGTHRLKTTDGKLHIVAANWLHIEIENESGEWTV